MLNLAIANQPFIARSALHYDIGSVFGLQNQEILYWFFLALIIHQLKNKHNVFLKILVYLFKWIKKSLVYLFKWIKNAENIGDFLRT